MNNQEIRRAAKEKSVSLWEIADELKISEPTMTRKLRHELPEDEKAKILALIEEIAERRVNNEYCAENENSAGSVR